MFFNPLEICIIGNKTDMADEREIPTSTGQEFAQSVRALFTETTAKDSKGTHHYTSYCKKIIIFMNIANEHSGTMLIPQLTAYCKFLILKRKFVS